MNLPDEVVKAAQDCQRKFGILSSTILAQYALESGWGKKESGKFNYFGIKFSNRPLQTGGRAVMTHEETKSGKVYSEKDSFANYATLEDGFIDHADLIANNDRYKPAMDVKDDYRKFCYQLKICGYATDINYAGKLVEIIEKSGLLKYDKLPEVE